MGNTSETNEEGFEINDLSENNWDKIRDYVRRGVISDSNLSFILDQATRSYDKLRKKKERAEKKKPQVAIPKTVSYADSIRIWGLELVEEREGIEKPLDSKSAAFNPDFKCHKVWLNGLSVEEIIERFPEEIFLPNAKKYSRKSQLNYDKDKWFLGGSKPGYYIVSWDNPFERLTPSTEEAAVNDAGCWYMDTGLVLELLISLKKMNINFPDNIYFRTDGVNNHGKKFCIGVEDGQFRFKAFNGGKHQKTIKPCLWVK